MPRKCTAITARGSPCKAWARDGTDPPRCNAHAPQPELGSFYAASLRPDELADLFTYADDLSLDDEIACARVVLRRLLALLDAGTIHDLADDDPPDHLTAADVHRLYALSLQATRTIARLLRDKRALTGDAADGISGAIAQALDELSTEWGIPL